MVALASAGRWNHYDVILGVFLLCVGDLNLMSYKTTNSRYSVLHLHAYTREGARATPDHPFRYSGYKPRGRLAVRAVL